MQRGRLWIVVGIGVMTGLWVYQAVILPPLMRTDAVAAADAARAAAARAQDASDLARSATATP